ncbi:branched-chain amino acid aminotransferase [Nigerium massiliense]|uniref:branched-chain amino acid aminotransferase n=1 Tax=Nigerium massiliense TaxID=1522317 RepID=UPI00058B93D8|nr:branched-chain amino acid aminotransferase [Nigerium massiliense]
MSLTFSLQRNANPRTDADVAAIHAAPGFGQYFTDHMALATWSVEGGWRDDAIVPYGPLQLDPAAAVLHYAQEVFEGLKAYRHADGSIWLFRPEMNAARFAASAERLCLPVLPEEDFLTSIADLVKADARWVPSGETEKSLYLRPFMFASESFLGVRPARTVTYCLIASPVGAYFPQGVAPVDIWVTDEYSRAGIGGTGAAKCGGNYASSLIAQEEGYEHGCSQVLFIEASAKDRVEELGGMNVFLITKDGRLRTPALMGSILAGVTRDSILRMGERLGLRPDEGRITPDELTEGITSGEVVEAFCCGTAAVISPISGFKSRQGEVRLADGAHDQTLAIRNAILDVQYGRAEDTFGWMHRVA